MSISDRTVGRLSLYRRLLQGEEDRGVSNIFSHQLAALGGVTAAQIRRDLTCVGYVGSSRLGYSVKMLKEAIESYLTPRGRENLVLVGAGNLGRAFLDYFHGRHGRICVQACFDCDSEKVDRVIHGCRCYSMDRLDEIIRTQEVISAVIAVPAEVAQSVADQLVMAGVRGILNFAPVSLRVPRDVFVEGNDLITAIERVSFFARERTSSRVVSMTAR